MDDELVAMVYLKVITNRTMRDCVEWQKQHDRCAPFPVVVNKFRTNEAQVLKDHVSPKRGYKILSSGAANPIQHAIQKELEAEWNRTRTK